MKIYAVILIGLVVSTDTFAQWRGNRKNLLIGLEMTSSTRNFKITSDLANLAGSHMLQGNQYAILLGNRSVTGKIRLGDFNSNQKEKQLKASAYELITNFQPLQFVRVMPRLIEPYFTISIEHTALLSNGTYTPTPASQSSNANSASSTTCSCQCPASATSPTTKPVNPSPEPYSGRIVTTRANGGAGLKMHLEKGHLFFNMFAEIKYGIPLINTQSTQALLSSFSIGQKGIDFGVSIGFLRDRKIRFR